MKKLLPKNVFRLLLLGLALTGISPEHLHSLIPEPGSRLKVWISSSQDEVFFRQAADSLIKKHPGLSVDLEPVSAVDARSKLEIKGPSGLGPDLLVVPHDHLEDLRASGLIMPNLVYTPQRKAQFIPWALESVSFGTEILGFPLSVETLVLFYNKTLFPKPPATMEDLLIQGKKITGNGRYGLVFPVGDFYVAHGLLTAFGAQLFGSQGTDPQNIGLTSPAMTRGLDLLLKLKPLSLERAGDATWETVQQIFLEGRSGALFQGPWALPALTKAGFPLGIAPFPLVNGNRPRTFSGTMVLVVSSFTRFPKAAQELADFITTDAQLQIRFMTTGAIPPLVSFFSDRKHRLDPLVGPFLEQLESARPMPRIREMKYLWVPASGALNDAWDGRVTPAQALARAEQAIRTQMELDPQSR